jgi:cytolysin-activating lysine-acyltransferase
MEGPEQMTPQFIGIGSNSEPVKVESGDNGSRSAQPPLKGNDPTVLYDDRASSEEELRDGFKSLNSAISNNFLGEQKVSITPIIKTQSSSLGHFDLAGPLGHITWLMMQSPFHKHRFITDLEWCVLPPLLLRQYRIFRRKDVSVAYVSWARLTEHSESQFIGSAGNLRPVDWNNGARLWLVDCVAPFGGLNAILDELRNNVLKKERINLLRPDEAGVPRHVTLSAGEINNATSAG